MSGIIKKTIALVGVLLLAVAAWADEKTTFRAQAPLIVATGEPFRVEFTLNAKPDDESFTPPSFEGFEVLAGPQVARSQSIQYINGTMTQTYEFTYTYVLMSYQAGNFTIESARVAVDEQPLSSNTLPIEVVAEPSEEQSTDTEEAKKRGSNGSNSNESTTRPRNREERAQEQLSADDIQLRITLSRSEVFKGEPVLAAIKLYYRVPIVGISNVKYPSFNGFWAQELDVSQREPRRETLGGKVYESTVLMEYLLYPQQSGTLQIEAAEMEAVAQVVMQNSRDPFMGMIPDVYNVTRKLRSPKLSIRVKELPAGAPESFSGAVGRFSLTETAPSTQLAANSSTTYTLRISGSGNLRFVQAPKLALPSSFEQYDVKSTEQIKSSAGGASGYRQFEYPFIARAEGEYTIDPIRFTYFDPAKKQYVTLSTQPIHLTVTPDRENSSGEPHIVRGLSKEDVRLLGEDIRFIKSGDARLKPQHSPLLFSSLYWLLLGSIIGGYTLLFFVLRKQIRESRNLALVRGRRANKVAEQRFRNAKRAINEENRHLFYEEMLRALWGYMSDKLNIPVSNLTKDNVREELHKRGVAQEDTHAFSAIITQCEEAQYSPLASARMSDIYTAGVEFISRMESIIKKKR